MKILDLVKARYSVRKYLPNPVEKSKLDYIMECVRLAPSAVNFQPWRFAVVTESGKIAGIKAAYPREWMASVPCIIVACADHSVSWHRPSDGKDHADVDVAIAVEHLCLAAAEVGLGTCWVCNFNTQMLAELFPQPAELEAVAIIPIGHIAPDCENKPKDRKNLASMVERI